MPLAAYHIKGVLEAGCDEAGRGCLAGPVVAAAVILPPRVRIPGLDDSKKLTALQRDELRPLIIEKALVWAIAEVTPQEIDRINILQASFLAMHRAIDALTQRPEALLIDGNRFAPYAGIPHACMCAHISHHPLTSMIPTGSLVLFVSIHAGTRTSRYYKWPASKHAFSLVLMSRLCVDC